jgi:hypothetical protein
LNYRDRITNKDFQSKLSAKQLEKSVLHLDWEEQIQIMFDKAPRRLLLGDTPRLIDEWQVIPKLWDHLRHEIQLHWLIIPYWKKIIASTKTGACPDQPFMII